MIRKYQFGSFAAEVSPAMAATSIVATATIAALGPLDIGGTVREMPRDCSAQRRDMTLKEAACDPGQVPANVHLALGPMLRCAPLSRGGRRASRPINILAAFRMTP